MANIKLKLDELNGDLKEILVNLNTLNDSNYSKSSNNIRSLISKIQEEIKTIREEPDGNQYLKRSELYQTMTKQINEKFDSIIEEKKKLKNSIGNELSKTINKKKIINYQR
ncbi:MAG: hypothetical protein CR986_01645 [Ignavibacteriae bacterium]|nr:MAG: hypothetical protein CR986_01645 [Ignavibacteriota bacterium]